MYILGKIIKAGIRLGTIRSEKIVTPMTRQRRVLRRLLMQATDTAFGRHYRFDELLRSTKLINAFQKNVPLHDYDLIYNQWWSRAREGELNVSWPGAIPWFALSSGTSNASSKYIPVTKDMIRSMRKISGRMFCDVAKFSLPSEQFTRPMLMVGSCTTLTPEKDHWVGDLSGIIGLNRPFWLEKFYKPGKDITDLPEWQDRIDKIAEQAPQWDIGFVVGNPAWVQMIFERIIERYQLKHIHEIWPHFKFYVHGGIFFEPYRQTFEHLLGEPVTYMDSYMASEGFFAYQNRPETRDLKLVTDAGIFYEFIPFNEQNFDENGNMLPNCRAYTLDQVETGKDYAILLTTCSGAWRYLLGDTVRFTDLSRTEFKVTGRVKHYLSVVGEHLSVDNMNEAIQKTDIETGTGVKEFAVGAVPDGSHWAHQWYVSAENPHAADPVRFAKLLDGHLQVINDDYKVERLYALRDVRVEFLPPDVFYRWLDQQGKMNGQAKIPRVLKGATQKSWESFLHSERALI